MMKRAVPSSLILFVAACGAPKLEDARHPTGSQTLATSSDYSALYVANSFEDSVTRVPLGGAPAELSLEGEPTRIARAGDQVFVTLRAERKLAVLVDDGQTLDLAQTVPTGAEPIGVVANEAGTRVYVAASLEGKVLELDADTLQELRSWEIADEPRWLALHPADKLYVASAYNGTFSFIDLDDGEVHQTQLPPVVQFSDELGEEVELARRITGDPAISADGEYVAIPAMYLDTTTPVIEPDDTPTSEPRPVEEPVAEESGGYTGGSTERFNPTVAMIQVEASGEPHVEDAELVRVVGQTDDLEGYLASVTISPDGRTTYATIEGAGGVAAFPTRRADDEFSSSVFSPVFDEVDQTFGGRGFSGRTVIAGFTDMGPRGVAFVGDEEAYVYNFLDRTVQQVDVPTITGKLYGGEALDTAGGNIAAPSSVVGAPVVVTEARLPPDVEAGRRLFYSANDARMSATSVGLSCATCHFDGRADGITWTFERGPRQTPSLAGRVSLTEPVRWEGERATVSEDARITSQGLMGGNGITDADIEALTAFIDWTRDVDAPLKPMANDERVLAGKAIFERPDVACASCHNGERLTDNKAYDLLGLQGVVTRSLVGISGSPPYFHDGSAKTLREVLERARDGSMGYTGDLSEEEMDLLELYLRSL